MQKQGKSMGRPKYRLLDAVVAIICVAVTAALGRAVLNFFL